MKINHAIISLLFVLAASNGYSQNANKIVEQCYQACKQTHSGYYEMESKMKYYSSPDTHKYLLKTHFISEPEDSLFGNRFHSLFFYMDTFSGIDLYNRDTLFSAYTRNNSGSYMETAKFSKQIVRIRHNLRTFEPFMSIKHRPISSIAEGLDKKFTARYNGIAEVSGAPCYNIIVDAKLKKKKGQMFEITYQHYDLWIDTSSYILKRYVEIYKAKMGDDLQTQHKIVTLKVFNPKAAFPKRLQYGSSIPSRFMLKEYKKYVPQPLLEDGVEAPDAQFVNLEGDTVKLSDYKGKLVVMDFFYKGCGPCVAAIPGLERLYQKYMDKGLVVLGVDPYDKMEEVKEFVKKQKMTYPVVLADRKFPKNVYKVSGYPTIYVIDKEGRILESHVGYSVKRGTKELNKVIKKNL